MSTFDGVVLEFPDIRIDYFRRSPNETPQPLAFFLSHVHSDHLVGLEACRSPFTYCSPATRDILLRLERKSHRMNFARGILESRKQTYRHLKTLLKAIPLDTPTLIELSSGRSIRVTLLDANHCVGAVMFLIEGGGKSVLYTGDIRSEQWWVQSLARHPILLPYLASGTAKRFDAIYLDTTFATKKHAFKRFPSKAEGIRELLQQIERYPKGTPFYFDAWTFGYEDVWQALFAMTGSEIHVDEYRYGLYRALAYGSEPKAPEATKLVGYPCGNHFQQGCLTREPSDIHSCEKGAGCEIWSKDFVRITPIVSRQGGIEIAELGTGKAGNELEVSDVAGVGQLMALCSTHLQHEKQPLQQVLQFLSSVINDGVQSIFLDSIELSREMDEECAINSNEVNHADELLIEKLVPALVNLVSHGKQDPQSSSLGQSRTSTKPFARGDGLPKEIRFPYSRHSSYDELCHLIQVFKPRDVYPCTVDYTRWTVAHSMGSLFGHLYDQPPSFRHDIVMMERMGGHRLPSTLHNARADPNVAHENDDPNMALSMIEDIASEICLEQDYVRAALRRQTYDAVLRGASTWSDVGLVSVAGHQVREDEL